MVRLGVGIGAVGVMLNGLVVALATRPKLAKLIGWTSAPERSPTELGLVAEDVNYAEGCQAWWIEAHTTPDALATGAVVIVHGFETSDNPRATDLGPRLEVAAALWAAGLSSLVVNLGYASGEHAYSAGALEAADIGRAVDWIEARSQQPIGIYAVSAGGHAAIACGRADPRVSAVVTDSAFADGAETVAVQAAELLHLPHHVFGLVPWLMRLITGVAPIDLAATTSTAPPMLHFHGDADTAVHVTNAERLGLVTGGEVVISEGADHVRSHATDPTGYEQRIVEFFAEHLSADRSDRAT